MEVLTPDCHPERSEGSAASVSLSTVKKLLLGGRNAWQQFFVDQLPDLT
jgi:hypothetical protein